MTKIPFKIRDRRDKGWFYLDNEYLNGYAKIFGAIGTAIYVSLCRHADNVTQECFPSMNLMAEELGLSRQTVSKYLDLFEAHRIIAKEMVRDKETQKWKNNTYWLLDKSEWVSHVKQIDMDSHVNLTAEPCQSDSDSHVKQINNKETQLTRLIEGDSYESVEFDQFWEKYPKKVKKKEAQKAWKKLSPSKELLSEILTAVEAQSKTESWRKEAGQFVPHPSSWLNGARWQDEAPKVVPRFIQLPN